MSIIVTEDGTREEMTGGSMVRGSFNRCYAGLVHWGKRMIQVTFVVCQSLTGATNVDGRTAS